MHESESLGLVRPIYDDGVVVSSIADKNAAGYRGGLREKDVILKCDQQLIQGRDTTTQDFVSLIRNKPNIPIDMEILRQGKNIHVFVTPDESGLQGKGSIGIGIASKARDFQYFKASNPLEAIMIGSQETYRMTDITVTSLKNFLSNLVVASGDVGGPISVMKAGAQLAENGPSALLGFMAALSVNLAVINALPFPALDGGQFVFAFLELLSKKKLPREIQENVTAVAFGILLLFSLSTIVNDVAHINDPVKGLEKIENKRNQ